MGMIDIRSLLETQLDTALPKIKTVWENQFFAESEQQLPYQTVEIVPNAPLNLEMSSNYIEKGILHVSLFYPMGDGVADIIARAELIRSLFPFRSTLNNSTTVVLITGTPEISSIQYNNILAHCLVSVRWQSQQGIL